MTWFLSLVVPLVVIMPEYCSWNFHTPEAIAQNRFLTYPQRDDEQGNLMMNHSLDSGLMASTSYNRNFDLKRYRYCPKDNTNYKKVSQPSNQKQLKGLKELNRFWIHFVSDIFGKKIPRRYLPLLC